MADQLPFWAPPDESDPVAELGQGKLERLHGRGPVALVETCLELIQAKLPALEGPGHVRSALPGLEGKRGECEY